MLMMDVHVAYGPPWRRPMKSEQAKPLQVAAQHAADWCAQKLEMKEGGYGKNYEHSGTERAALQVAHSIAVCEVARLQPIVDGR
jgi:hypothetical protein